MNRPSDVFSGGKEYMLVASPRNADATSESSRVGNHSANRTSRSFSLSSVGVADSLSMTSKNLFTLDSGSASTADRYGAADSGSSAYAMALFPPGMIWAFNAVGPTERT